MNVLTLPGELWPAVKIIAGHRLADPCEVFDGRCDASHTLVTLRPRLETPGDVVMCRAQLVRLQSFEDIAPSPQDSLVRTEELVGRTDEEVASQRLDIRCDVRRGLHAVDVGQRPCITRPGANRSDAGDQSQRRENAPVQLPGTV